MTRLTRYSLPASIGVQIIAALMATGVSACVGGMPLWSWVIAQSICALGLSVLIKLRGSWHLVHALFVPLLFAINYLALPAWVYLLAFVGLWLVSVNVVGSHVPLVRSPKPVIEALSHELKDQAQGRFIDVGCGVGSVLKPLAQRHLGLEFIGVENAPLSYWIAKWRTRNLPNCHIYYQSLWQHSLADYQWVYCFLSPTPMTRLWQKACVEMKHEALLISNQMPVEGVTPLRTLVLNGRELLFWQPAHQRESR